MWDPLSHIQVLSQIDIFSHFEHLRRLALKGIVMSANEMSVTMNNPMKGAELAEKDLRQRPTYARLEADVVDAGGKPAYGVVRGVRESAKENEISADMANVPDLLPGEKVSHASWICALYCMYS